MPRPHPEAVVLEARSDGLAHRAHVGEGGHAPRADHVPARFHGRLDERQPAFRRVVRQARTDQLIAVTPNRTAAAGQEATVRGNVRDRAAQDGPDAKPRRDYGLGALVQRHVPARLAEQLQVADGAVAGDVGGLGAPVEAKAAHRVERIVRAVEGEIEDACGDEDVQRLADRNGLRVHRVLLEGAFVVEGRAQGDEGGLGPVPLDAGTHARRPLRHRRACGRVRSRRRPSGSGRPSGNPAGRAPRRASAGYRTGSR